MYDTGRRAIPYALTRRHLAISQMLQRPLPPGICVERTVVDRSSRSLEGRKMATLKALVAIKLSISSLRSSESVLRL